ncbi:hypothetical protein P9112_007093 [Eukaryota sp. TZLM1-RC]
MFPSLKMIAYMDDVVLIGDLNIVKQATVCFKEIFTKIGLRLNLLKCDLSSNSPISTIGDGIKIQAKLYSIDAIRHLGSFLGNNDEITKKLFEKLNSISDKIDRMMNLDIQKHIKFTIIRLCFSSNFNHIFRYTNPLVTRPLAQKLNELHAKVLSQLLGCKMFQIPDHAYLSPDYGGLGWTKASILTSLGRFIDDDPCNASNEHLINSDANNPLLAGKKYKIAKYAKPISSINENSHAQYNLYHFVFSLLGFLGKAAMAFLEDFVVVVKERTGKIFNRVYWQNRIVFSIFKGMVKLISDSLSSFGKFSESLAINCFDVGDAGFEDVEF